MNRLTKILAPVAVIATGAGIIFALDVFKPEPEKKQEASQAPSLFVAKVSSQEVTIKVVTQAEVKANTEVDVISQITGMVKAVSSEYIEGGSFNAGETLVWIDDADYQLALKRAQAQVASASVRVEQVEADAEVARRQLRGVKNPSSLALKKPQLAEAKANLIAAEADLALAQLNLSRTKISLPFKGRLKSIEANVGQFISVGSKLGRAFATDKVKLRLPLTDNQLASLRLPIGFIATKDNAPVVNFKAMVAGQAMSWQGRLNRVDAAYDSSTRLLYALAEVENPYDQAVPLAVGLYVSAEIFGETMQQAMVIPRAALRAGNKIYVVNSKKKLDVRQVQVVDKTADRVLIQGAVQVGEEVVISPLRNPTQGMAVTTLHKDEGAAAKLSEQEILSNG